jgi:hypothetical protein
MCLLVALIGSVVVEVPARAAYGVVVIAPSGPVYSPFRGPVTVSFTFDDGDPARVFTVRLRRPGAGTIKEQDFLIDPEVGSSPTSVSFAWRELSVASSTEYAVDVRRQGDGAVITSDRFTILPKLVSGVIATPSPFYPLIEDGFKDTARIDFSLAVHTKDTVVRIFESDAYGSCCGAEIRTADLGPLPAGEGGWTWDGNLTGGGPSAEGVYFAKIEATDSDDVSLTSRAARVELATGLIRRTATRDKPGSGYAAVTDERRTAIGGDCSVSRDADVGTAFVLCANAAISVLWRWKLEAAERIESVAFKVDGGYYGCHATKDHTGTRSVLRVTAPPTSTCTISSATIRYSYPFEA